MRFGAHVPTRGRLSKAIDYAVHVGAEAIQLFISNPRAWAPPPARDERLEEFAERRRVAGIDPVFVHSSYLINVASPNPAVQGQSVILASQERIAASSIGADGLVVHAGSGGLGERTAAMERAAASVKFLLEAPSPPVLLELTAGGSGSVASTIPHAQMLLEAIDDERVGLVLDTCHLLSAGYPLDEPGTGPTPFEELREAGLASRLNLLHANDSRDARGSKRDRHAHIGKGTIGEHGFAAILADETVRKLPIVIETPDDEPEDLQNLATLRRLAAFDGPAPG
jgi:deoxyribonuclease IV